MGSPPRMRGKQSVAVCPQVQIRITPADAGKTLLLQDCTPQKTDHPRGCGENPCRYFLSAGDLGSPPRMRGKPDAIGIFGFAERITPADAGKTVAPDSVYNLDRDHPRGCGENSYSNGVSRENSGSPPRMRGKPKAKNPLHRSKRITPADAGKTKKAKK